VETADLRAGIDLPLRVRRPPYVAVIVAATATGLWLSDVFRTIDHLTIRYGLITLTLGVAARLAFVKASPRSDELSVVSPWIPVAALAFAIALAPVRGFLETGDSDPAGTLARRYGLVAPGHQVTAVDRCIARQLHETRQNPSLRPERVTAPEAAVFYRRVCGTALLQSLLLLNGTAIDRDQFAQIEQNTLATFVSS
jgi:hypothetical protein